MRFGMMIALLLMGFAIGCNSEPAPVTVTPGPPPMKKVLDEMAASGAMTSGIMDVESGLNGLKKTDAAKAEKLLKELSGLQSAKTPEEIKAKAKAMADQL